MSRPVTRSQSQRDQSTNTVEDMTHASQYTDTMMSDLEYIENTADLPQNERGQSSRGRSSQNEQDLTPGRDTIDESRRPKRHKSKDTASDESEIPSMQEMFKHLQVAIKHGNEQMMHIN